MRVRGCLPGPGRAPPPPPPRPLTLGLVNVGVVCLPRADGRPDLGQSVHIHNIAVTVAGVLGNAVRLGRLTPRGRCQAPGQVLTKVAPAQRLVVALLAIRVVLGQGRELQLVRGAALLGQIDVLGLVHAGVREAALHRGLVDDHGVLHVITARAQESVSVSQSGGAEPPAIECLARRTYACQIRKKKRRTAYPVYASTATMAFVPLGYSSISCRSYASVRAIGVCGFWIRYILVSVRCAKLWTGVPMVCLPIWHWYMLRGDWL